MWERAPTKLIPTNTRLIHDNTHPINLHSIYTTPDNLNILLIWASESLYYFDSHKHVRFYKILPLDLFICARILTKVFCSEGGESQAGNTYRVGYVTIEGHLLDFDQLH